ncbi:hypothetical protein [Sphingomonas oryzagri]|uniref:Uncharacterized protein n=1 Tax=Sphingomonas oryzagri TaxID=3042314 RepID=A0ABT6N166_9SPHN|nr:hypothetical protein [Sphingomonas oryzagri]MDH7638937.1 hypothetical protein [Sphingomonas oryzagri]
MHALLRLLDRLGYRQSRDDHTHALRLQMSARLLARREARKVSNARAAKGAATKIHQQFDRDPLIRARLAA